MDLHVFAQRRKLFGVFFLHTYRFSFVSGLFSILLQLAIADIALGASISVEIWSYNMKNWTLGNCSCVAYRGLSIFASTASAYLVATVALHTLATANLEENTLARRLRRKNQDDDEEIRSSRHSLVASSDSSTPPRTMNLDYRINSSRVPVTQPAVFVWLLAISLSVPDFSLATTVELDNSVICTIVDSSRRLHLYSILALFNLFAPAMIICTAGALVIKKLKSKKLVLSQIEGRESLSALKLSLSLIVIYFVLCAPRSVLTTYYVYSTSMRGNESTLIESIHHGNANASSSIGLALSCVYLSSILVRPLLCIILLPSVRKAFSYNHGDTDNV